MYYHHRRVYTDNTFFVIKQEILFYSECTAIIERVYSGCIGIIEGIYIECTVNI